MVTRVFAGGRLLSTAMRRATTTRGKLSISQEEDPVRHRRVLVARLSTGSNGMKVVPPLYDVAVVGCTGEWWTIAGHERVISGPIGEEYVLGQSWLIQPAQCEDLAKAEAEWRRLAEELHVLRERVAKEATGPPSVG